MQSNDLSAFDGTIVKGVGGLYSVRRGDGHLVFAKPRGLFRKKRIVPTVGDHVLVSPTGDPDIPYIIDTISPRRNLLMRPPIANVDVLFLTFSTRQPVPYYELLDKLIILCKKNNIHPVIWITKMDLNPREGNHFKSVYEKIGFDVYATTHTDPIDAETMSHYFDGQTVGFAGQSGVGKSTLCNMLTGINEREVGKISERLNQGKHTTRHVELFPFKNGYLIDSPGFTNLDILQAQIDIEDIMRGYPEIAALSDQCQFADCLHLGEKGCAVEHISMDPGRLERYRAFINEAKKFTYNQNTQKENQHVRKNRC